MIKLLYLNSHYQTENNVAVIIIKVGSHENYNGAENEDNDEDEDDDDADNNDDDGDDGDEDDVDEYDDDDDNDDDITIYYITHAK